MPAQKRKLASTGTSEDFANQRRTRSHGPLEETQPAVVTSQPRSTKRPKSHKDSKRPVSPTKSRRGNHENVSPSYRQSGLQALDDDDDELLLSPSKGQSSGLTTPSRAVTPRYIMHSVEITTPARRLSKLPQLPTNSPVSQSPARASGSRTDRIMPTINPFLQRPNARSSPSPTRPSSSTVFSPRKSIPISPKSPSRLPSTLPQHLHACLQAQKRAILRDLQDPPDPHMSDDDDQDPTTNDIAFQQLCDLLDGTVDRGEGNSCLLVGPRGSGKTRLVERCLKRLPQNTIVVRLSGCAQSNDRLAMREIAWQLLRQTGVSFLAEGDDSDGESNPFLDVNATTSLPSSTHLPALISVLPTLSRPTVVVLESFDRFALHVRQALLYCLFDTAQSCQVSEGNKGLAIVGVTSRVDTITLLEKRVKSRFSGRILRTAPPRGLMYWLAITRNVLCAPIEDEPPEWRQMWHAAVDAFLADIKVVNAFSDTFGLTGDIRVLIRILTALALDMGPSTPFPSATTVTSAVIAQRCRHRFSYLHNLAYPLICLLIATMHTQTAGHDIFTFEMLHECFRDQVRSSTSAPIQVEGGGISMVRCSREVLMGAFERLVSVKAFVPVTAPSSSISKEFVRYRCVVDREDVKKAVETTGQTNLKKWLNKAQ